MATILAVDETSGEQNAGGSLTANDTALPLPNRFAQVLTLENAGGGTPKATALSGVDGTVTNSSGTAIMSFGPDVLDVGFVDGNGDPLDGVDSGLKTSDGTSILLYTSSFDNNVVLGRAGS